MMRTANINNQARDKRYVMPMKIAQEILPPTRPRQVLYTLFRVSPVERQPTNRIIRPSPPMPAPTTMKVSWTGSTLYSRSHLMWSLKTSSNILRVRVVPRYMVPQNTPTPTQHMTVAMRVAYGTRVMQSRHFRPMVPDLYAILYMRSNVRFHFLLWSGPRYPFKVRVQRSMEVEVACGRRRTCVSRCFMADKCTKYDIPRHAQHR